jgi:ectonucleotide pyrophosphatase/phosphodiesterase family protein 1/3
MDLPEDQRPSFVTLYFEEPDSTGHKEGPNSFKVNRRLEAIIFFTEKIILKYEQVTEKVALVDRYIRKLIDGLAHRNIFSCVNIIIVSDHGMAHSQSGEQLVYLQKYIPDLEETTIAFYGEVPSIRPKNDTEGI